MPIDPSIIARAVPPAAPAPSPLQTLDTLGQLEQTRTLVEARRLAADEARQKAADEAAIRRAVTETGGDWAQALPRLRQVAPRAALSVESALAKQQKEHFESLKAQTDFEAEQTTRGLRYFNAANEQTWPQIYPQLVAQHPDLARLVTPQWDADRVGAVHRMGLSTKDDLEEQRRSLTLVTDGKTLEGLRSYFSTLRSEPEWQAGLEKFAPIVPRDILALIGPWSADAPARVAEQAIAPAKRVELAGQAETRAQTERRQTVQEELQRGQLAVSQGQLGVAQAREKREAAAVGAGGVKLSPTQQEDISTMMTVQQLGREALRLGEENKWTGVGPYEGRVGSTMLGYGGASGEALRNKIGNIQGTIAKLRGGTSFTPNEQKLLESYTPTVTDPVTKIQTKLATLNEFIENKRQNTLRVAAGQYTLPSDTGTAAGPTEGDVKPIPGFPGTEQTYRNGRWIRTK